MKFIIGKKIEMTQKYDYQGNRVPLTVVQVGPCVVTQIKSEAKDGYKSVQVAFGEKKSIAKPQKGHIKEVGEFFTKAPLVFKEFRCENAEEFKVGQVLTTDLFNKGEKVSVTGKSKGKGFAGVMKRHHFKGKFRTHGTKDQMRMPGSIGDTAHNKVMKGKRMAGRMGFDNVTVKNLDIFEVDSVNNLIYVKGPVPGARNTVIFIKNNENLDVSKLKHFKDISTKAEIINQEVVNTEEVKSEENKV